MDRPYLRNGPDCLVPGVEDAAGDAWLQHVQLVESVRRVSKIEDRVRSRTCHD